MRLSQLLLDVSEMELLAAKLSGFFDGLTVVPPGIVSASQWPDSEATVCGVGFNLAIRAPCGRPTG